jgi:hypothetical protein
VIHLHATRKLFAKLPVDAAGRIPLTPRTEWLREQAPRAGNPLTHWHGNLVTIQRRQCILLVHDETRFPVFLPCMTKPDIAELNDRFIDGFINTLLKCGADDALLDAAQAYMAPLQADTSCSRSVQGTLNRMAFETEHMLHYQGVDVREITGNRVGAWLADTPWNIKGRGHVWPNKEMLALLAEGGQPRPVLH